MKNALFIIFILFICAFKPADQTSFIDYAFERGNNIYYHIYNVNKLIEIKEARDPNLSPDGLKLAFKKNVSKKTENFSQIKIFYFKSDSTYTINIKSSINGSPKWSPDGSVLGFTTQSSGELSLSTYDSTATVKSTKPAIKSDGIVDFYWLDDGKSYSVNDFDSLWVLDNYGKVKQSFEMYKITKGKWFVLPTTMFMTQNDFYFGAYNDKAKHKLFVDGPAAIYKYTFLKDKLVKLTNNEILCMSIFIKQGNSIYVSAWSNTKCRSHCIYKVDNKGTRIVLKDAMNLTLARHNSLERL